MSHRAGSTLPDIFSTEVRPEAAKHIPPMELDVDVEKWNGLKGNTGGARPVSRDKQLEIERQTTAMVGLGVIQPSKAGQYSQVLLVPKPGGKWRFCIDYVKLNECTRTKEAWPLPNIPAMLDRVGRAKPTYFAKMDLTSGYHQAPLSTFAAAFTAFIVWCGVFQWLRVPMGLKGAPAYFQRVMATVVLAGLMYTCCELYIDDLLIHDRTFEGYIDKLDRVFKQLRHHNITVNPTKCEFGLREVEFVGHVVNAKGLSMSESRKEAVFQIPEPKFAKDLKSFVGAAGYFQRFIPNYSTKIHPLNQLLHNYERNRRLEWNPEAKAAWDSIREDIRQCQTLHFYDEHSPVYLHTDASDYALGAYLFQLVDGIEQPIAFLSRSFTETEQRWTVTERECYAFVYAFQKFEYLLRDIHFTLRTDHKNLTYVNDSVSPKVRRWKILICQYDYDIEYIKGEHNIMADATSRLAPRLVSRHDDESLFAVREMVYREKNKPSRTIRWQPSKPRWLRPIGPAPAYTPAWEITKLLATLVEPEFKPWAPTNNGEPICSLVADKFVIPKDNSSVGHHGVSRTMMKIKEYIERYNASQSEDSNRITSWPSMREHVKVFIKGCPCCQLMSQIKIPIHTRGFTTASVAPLSRISIDTIGPLPNDGDGYQYIVVIVDNFTRWTELYAARTATAEAATESLLSFIKTFGQPQELVSDNGPQYVAKIVAQLVAILGVERVHLVPYSHEQNSIVERANKEVVRHLRALVFDDKTFRNWAKKLCIVQRIINTTVHDAIGVAPSQLLFGNAIRLDPAVIIDPDFLLKPKTNLVTSLNMTGRHVHRWADEMLTTQAHLMQKAAQLQHDKDQLHMAIRAKMAPEPTVFALGSYVKAAYEPTAMGSRAPDKLTMPYRGPYTVVGHSPGEYELRDPSLPHTFWVSEHLLQPYVVDPEHRDPVDIAIQQRKMSIIESIVEAKGFPPHTRSLQFLIKWRDEPAPQWYYWTPSFRHYPVVHDFLRAYAQTTQNRNWLRLIPKQHRRDQPAVEYNEEAEQRFLQDLRVVTPGHHLSQPEEVPTSGGDLAPMQTPPETPQSLPLTRVSTRIKKRVKFADE